MLSGNQEEHQFITTKQVKEMQSHPYQKTNNVNSCDLIHIHHTINTIAILIHHHPQALSHQLPVPPDPLSPSVLVLMQSNGP